MCARNLRAGWFGHMSCVTDPRALGTIPPGERLLGIVRRPGKDGRAPREVSVSRILIQEPRRDRHDWQQLLAASGHDVVVCTGREALFDAMALRRPDLIIYVLGDLALDLGVLWVVRHMAGALPIILLGGATGLEARRSVQELKPVYFGVFPLDPAELTEAVRGALSHERRGALAS